MGPLVSTCYFNCEQRQLIQFMSVHGCKVTIQEIIYNIVFKEDERNTCTFHLKSWSLKQA